MYMSPAIPVLRIFSEEKAKEFYEGFLGFTVDWEHRFTPDLPLYMQLHRADLKIHLSEHHGDATPGSTIFVPVTGVEALRDELHGKHYKYGRPGIEVMPWGKVLVTLDPFGNRIRFCEFDETNADDR
ncbi:glyoxalase superfamily protein [Paraburkholderia bonniea]|uniref:glyoxalase superfamily protein n=1 Tax=Paraburkholderia bonniea TaxID=2152891 RepID=UPI001291EA1C|nr:glyoxalase superfamily protein [Paraburkholderia bonniea]WJF91387.1 glyoxalase superfamily protein [Paraburkholderia bonniea]WJF94703.1 glyoxalase superfamily protein [Paraburkholderia bonniea]